MSERPLRIAVVGDIHGHWSDADVAWFNGAGLDLVLFVGDLGGYRHAGTLRVATGLSGLLVPSLWIPGNHDGAHPLQLLGEMLGNDALIRSFSRGQDQRMDAIRAALGPVVVAGYSLHPVAGADLDVLAARPHSMGGPRLSFAPYLERAHGVASLEQSAERLKRLVASSTASSLVVLAHNGPTGLGARRSDLWGCDFRPEEGDFGDPDLEQALAHARHLGKRVVAVVAGHMHRALEGGGQRVAQLERDQCVFVNAAEVPRIRRDRSTRTRLRHHVELRIGADTCTARDHWIGGAAEPGLSPATR